MKNIRDLRCCWCNSECYKSKEDFDDISIDDIKMVARDVKCFVCSSCGESFMTTDQMKEFYMYVKANQCRSYIEGI